MAIEQVKSGSEAPADVQLSECLIALKSFFKRARIEEALPEAEPATIVLDELWARNGLEGERCLVGGYGISSEPVQPPENRAYPAERGSSEDSSAQPMASFTTGSIRKIVNEIGLSAGFVVADVFEEGHLLPWHLFYLSDEQGVEQPTLVLADQDFGFKALPVTPVAEVLADSELGFMADSELELPGEILRNYSENFRELLMSRIFRNAGHEGQIQLIDSYIAQAEQASGVRKAGVTLFANRAYRLSGLTSRRGMDVPRDEVINIRNVLIRGVCQGLTVTDYRWFKQKGDGNRKADAMSQRDGLALVVVMDPTAEFPASPRGLRPGSRIIVSLGQLVKATFELQDEPQDFGIQTTWLAPGVLRVFDESPRMAQC